MLDKVKKELMNIIIILIIFIVIFKIVFYKENLIIIIRILISLFWILISGFFIMYYWHEKIGFLPRLIIGCVLSFALLGVFSYYFGLIGIHVKYHGIIIPLLFYALGFFLVFKRFK